MVTYSKKYLKVMEMDSLKIAKIVCQFAILTRVGQGNTVILPILFRITYKKLIKKNIMNNE